MILVRVRLVLFTFLAVVGCGELTERPSSQSSARDATDDEADAALAEDVDGGLDVSMTYDASTGDAGEWGLGHDAAMQRGDGESPADGDLDGGLLSDSATNPGDAETVDVEVLDSEVDDAGGADDADVEASDVDPNPTRMEALDPDRFSWAYDSKDLCALGVDSDWTPAAGSVVLEAIHTATIGATPICNASTAGLIVDASHTDTAVALNDGACWSSRYESLPSVDFSAEVLFRALLVFPSGKPQNLYLAGLRAGHEYMRWYHQGAKVVTGARTEDPQLLVASGFLGPMRMDQWTLLDVLYSPAPSGGTRVQIWVNGERTETTAAEGLGVVSDPMLLVGSYFSDCSEPGNQVVLFLGLSLGSKSAWFDPNGDTHVRDCRSLGLCR